MSGEGKGSLKAIASAGGAGGLFLIFWLGLGVPLVFSAAAGGLGYVALWFVFGGARGLKEIPVGSWVDKELARKTVAEAFAAAKALDDAAAGFAPRDAFMPRFRRLSELLRAIGRDVESDPKDAQAASVFVNLQGGIGARLAKLCLALQTRGASPEQVDEARARISTALDRLVVAHERHLAHLQEDNLDELRSELELLEQSLGFEEEFENELRRAVEGSNDRGEKTGSRNTGGPETTRRGA